MVLTDIELRRPGSSRLTQVPTEYTDLWEANRDHIKTQNAVLGTEMKSLRPFKHSYEVFSDYVTIE